MAGDPRCPVDDLMEEFAPLIAGGGWMAVIHPGSPCTCGAGFCSQQAGPGGFGWCRDSRDAPAEPDCPQCGAPHQGREEATGRLLCWNCCEYHEEPYRMHGSEDWPHTLERARDIARRVRAGEVIDVP